VSSAIQLTEAGACAAQTPIVRLSDRARSLFHGPRRAILERTMSLFFWSSLLFWSLTAAAAVHILEEFVLPGGFKAWYQAYRPQAAASVTNRFLVVINAVLLATCVNVALVGPSAVGVAAWLTLAALLFSNAVFHVVGAWQTRHYSPGMVSGLVLYVPLTLYGFFHFLRSGQAPVGTALLALALGGSYPLVSSALHRRRARQMKARHPAA
jgi:hypothetical protein